MTWIHFLKTDKKDLVVSLYTFITYTPLQIFTMSKLLGAEYLVFALQSLTGKYRGLQGNPCNENRDPVMRTGVPCNENRFFPVKKLTGSSL